VTVPKKKKKENNTLQDFPDLDLDVDRGMRELDDRSR
jgi:hypothetical protein